MKQIGMGLLRVVNAEGVVLLRVMIDSRSIISTVDREWFVRLLMGVSRVEYAI